MTEILLLGTFHFMESPIDFYCEEVQDELELLAGKLQLFHPDAIAVEAAASTQASIDESYRKFSLEDLRNQNNMKDATLGDICMFGETHPITYNDESVQVGYRLGKMSGLDKIYAIDDDAILNMDAMNHPTPLLTEAMNLIRADMEEHADGSIWDLYQYYNSVGFSKLNHDVYIQANAISIDGNYAGADMVAKWYERNLKIFSNIQRPAMKSRQLFVIYGAWHLRLLREFIRADSSLELVDVYKYL